MKDLHERALLITLAALFFTHVMDFMIIMPLGPQLMRMFAITPQQFSLLVTSYTFSAGAVSFLASFLVDRFDRKHVVIWSYIGCLLGTFACAFAPSYLFLLLSRTLAGAFGGILGSQILSVVADVIPLSRRGSAMGTVTASFSAASAFGVPFGLLLANLFSWHAPFLFLSMLGVIVVFCALKYIPSVRGHVQEDGHDESPLAILRRVLSNGNQRMALSLSVILMFAQFSIVPFLSPAMVSNVGFTEKQLTYIYVIGGFCTLFTGPIWGKLADRWGLKKIFILLSLIAILPIVLISNMSAVPVPVALFVTTMFFIFAGGRMVPAMTMITASVAPKERGGFMSINASVQQVASGLSALVAGLIVTKGVDGKIEHYPTVGIIAVLTTFLCIWLASRLRAVSQL